MKHTKLLCLILSLILLFSTFTACGSSAAAGTTGSQLMTTTTPTDTTAGATQADTDPAATTVSTEAPADPKISNGTAPSAASDPVPTDPQDTEPKETEHTIEGNSGNACKRNTYPITDSRIAGYGSPDYESLEPEDLIAETTGTILYARKQPQRLSAA